MPFSGRERPFRKGVMVEAENKGTRIVLKRTAGAVVFLALVFLLLSGLGELLRYKWEYDVTPAYESWEAQPEDSIDVLFFSSSLIKRGVTPMVLYREAGITAFNWGQAWGNAPVEYFQFLYCMKAPQHPKLVVIDARDMFVNRSVENYKPQPYQKFMATMPDGEIRSAMLEEILSASPSEKRVEWTVPLLCYHSRWKELEPRDFTGGARNYKEYLKGCQLLAGQASVGGRHGYAKSRSEASVPDPYSRGFYDEIARICTERGIRLAVLTMPERTAVLTREDCEVLREWCDSVGAIYWDYLDAPWEEKLGLSPDLYADTTHLNPEGAIRFSTYFAGVLKDTGLLPDHRGEPEFAGWETCLEAFSADYPG